MPSQNSAVREESDEDKQNEVEYTTTIGYYNNYEVSAAVRRVPGDGEYPDELSVNIYVPHADRENDSIVRIDDDHGEMHIDRRYLDKDSDLYKDFGIDVKTAEEAIKYFVGTEDAEEPRWKTYTRRYEENHGL